MNTMNRATSFSRNRNTSPSSGSLLVSWTRIQEDSILDAPRGKEPVLKTWTKRGLLTWRLAHISGPQAQFPSDITSILCRPNDPLVIAPGVPGFVDIPFPLPSILRSARNARNAQEYLRLSGPLHGERDWSSPKPPTTTFLVPNVVY